MISIHFPDQDVLGLDFSTPIPSTAGENPEWKRFLEVVEACAGRIRTGREQELCGIELPVAAFTAHLEKVFPETSYHHCRGLLTYLQQNRRGLEKKGLDVNFHQKSFDTSERFWNFTLNQGNFTAFLLNRIAWFTAPFHDYIADFPLHVDLESASTCNMQCPMCYRDQLKKTGQMEMSLFRKAVDECARNGLFSLRLSWRGETLTHPRIKEMIAYASARIPNVSFLTNAFYLDEEMIDCFIDSGVSYIAVSFDGIGDTYETIRHPAKFRENYERLRLLKERREKKKSLLPQVRLCTIWPAIRNNPEEYYSVMKEVSDYIVCNPYINFKGPMEIKPDFICQYPWERIVVGFDGDAQCCTGWNADDIVLGNVAETPIRELWQSSRMDEIRRIHSENRRMSLSSCAACRHGSKGDPDISIQEIIERKY